MVLNPKASVGLIFPQQTVGNITMLLVRHSGTRRWIEYWHELCGSILDSRNDAETCIKLLMLT